MNIFKKYKNLWMAGIIVVIAILFIVNFSEVVNGVKVLLGSFSSLLAGAALAFILNLIMDPVEQKLLKCKNKFFQKHARGTAILVSFLVTGLLIALILSIVIPNMVSAVQMLADKAPKYIDEVEDLIKKILTKIPGLSDMANDLTIDWKSAIETLMNFLSKGSGVMDSTINMVTSVIGSVVNTFVIVIFACYVLADKERFVRMYYTLTDLSMTKERQNHLTRNLRILNQSFKSFIAGEIIEAGILSTMCIVGMLILQLPYATMIGILVGVINMIPMIGAFIGGGIGAFIIFTISPTKCLIFIVFLCVIQQIESNIFFPRVIGNKVGLPGIYVMMTIVVGGTLFGVFGMVLGVPLVAAIYKIARDYIAEAQARKHLKEKIPEDSTGGTDDPILNEE